MKEIDPNLKSLIDSLLRGGERSKIQSLFTEVITHQNIEGTEAISHSYVLNIGGNNQPKTKELVQHLFFETTRYCIPRKDLELAIQKDQKIGGGSLSNTTALIDRARSLFISGSHSGEAGEVLLYTLIEDVLNKPQLLCKMKIKSDSEMHYHGIDGMHASVDKGKKGEDIFCLYWGEAKLKGNIGDAIREAITEMKEFLLEEDGSPRTEKGRDLQLLTDNLKDLNDEALENALVEYLDPSSSRYGDVHYKGVCLIGFDYEHYPDVPNSGVTTEDIKMQVEKDVGKWLKSIKGQISKHTNLSTFEIHVFIMPFQDVAEFKKSFVKRFSTSKS